MESDEIITKSEVENLARKLEEWGLNLPEQERILLDFLLARASGIEETDPAEIEIILRNRSIEEATKSALISFVGSNYAATTRSFIRMGPPSFVRWSGRAK